MRFLSQHRENLLFASASKMVLGPTQSMQKQRSRVQVLGLRESGTVLPISTCLCLALCCLCTEKFTFLHKTSVSLGALRKTHILVNVFLSQLLTVSRKLLC